MCSKHIFALAETWTNCISNVVIPGYEHYACHRPKRNPRAKRDSGGIIVYVRTEITKGVQIVKNGPNEIIWLKLNKDFFGLEYHILACFSYIIPQNSSHNAYIERDLFDEIAEDMSNFEEKYDCKFFIAGDLNGRTGCHLDHVEYDDSTYIPLPDNYEADISLATRKNNDKIINDNGHRLLELCKMCNVRIVNGRIKNDKEGLFTCITHRGQSAVDVVLSSPMLFKIIDRFSVSNITEYSDHCMLNLDVMVREVKSSSSGDVTFTKLKWNSDLSQDYIQALNSDTCQGKLNDMLNVISNGDHTAGAVNEAVHMCVDAIRSASDPLFLTQIKNSGSDNRKSLPPWASNEWVNSKKKFYKCRDKYNSNSSESNRKSMVEARKCYKQLSFSRRRGYEKDNTSQLYKAKCQNVKLYWKLLSGKNHNETKVTKEEFFNHFMSLSNPSDPFYAADDDVIDELRNIMESDMQVVFDELNENISMVDIDKAIKDLKNGKSGGVDLLINELFIHGKGILLPYLFELFNFVLDSGVFPEDWSDGLLIPLHKKGDRSTPDNYRGITLLSVLGKLFTRVINNRLENWANDYNIYIEAQYGFRKGRSTVDCMFILHNVIGKFLENGNKLYAFFIDYSKAFDYIVRENLWFKLLKLGIRGKVFNVIKSMYDCVKTSVFINGEKSNSFECKLGVRQGESLSPFLFSMYINDMEAVLSNDSNGVTINDIRIILLFYADDCVVFSETPEGLQREIDLLYDYCNRWRLKVNTTKSKVIVFRKGNREVNYSWTFGGSPLLVCNKMAYLGNVFSANGSFNQTQITLAEQASKAMYSLFKRMNNNFYNVKPTFMLDIFDKCITPILNYGCEVWGFHPAPAIERIHLKFCKIILGVKKRTQNDFIYGELGRIPMQLTRYIRIIKYWLNIVTGKKSYLVTSLYHASVMRMDVDNSPSWARNVKVLLCSNGFGEAWYNQGVSNVDIFMNLFRQRILDTFKQEWHNRLEASSRASFYIKVKLLHQPSRYLSVVTPKLHRNALAKLMVSSHRLRVETGRWTRPVTPREQRTCFHCNKFEDEYHMILECNLYNNIRKELISEYYIKHPSMMKLVQLINSEKDNEIRGLAKFIYKAFIIRNQFVESL